MTVQIFHGDCLDVIPASVPRPVQLVYIDGPFCTQQEFRLDSGELAYSDRWRSIHEYVEYMSRRVGVSWEVLQPGRSLILHADHRAVHYLKIALDGVCGAEHFASEIIWRYRRWPAKTPNFQHVHDTLLRYVKPGAPPRFNQLYEELAPSTIAMWGTAKQRAVLDGDGRRVRSSASDDESPGVPLGDVWDVGIIAPMAHERTGYPTQKPERLLGRLLLSLTNPGDLVLDPMCGSGSMLIAADRLMRAAIGIDKSEAAVWIATERLRRAAPLLHRSAP